MENIEKWKNMSSEELEKIRDKYIAYIDLLYGMIKIKELQEESEEPIKPAGEC